VASHLMGFTRGGRMGHRVRWQQGPGVPRPAGSCWSRRVSDVRGELAGPGPVIDT